MSPTVDNGHFNQTTTHKVLKQHNGNGVHTSSTTNGQVTSASLISMEHEYGAHNYHPLPVVFDSAQGAKVWDPEGKEYIDMLSAYSAVNQVCHPQKDDALGGWADWNMVKFLGSLSPKDSCYSSRAGTETHSVISCLLQFCLWEVRAADYRNVLIRKCSPDEYRCRGRRDCCQAC